MSKPAAPTGEPIIQPLAAADLSHLAGHPIIVGAGLAGLSAALMAAPMPVTLITKSKLGDGCSSVWAQGGIAAAMGPEDSPASHAADTLAAGDGLCDEAAVRRITAAGPAAIARLEDWGVSFDREAGGAYALSLEAAHSRRRVLHAGGGDTAGRRIIEALVDRVRQTPSITVIEGMEVTCLLTAPVAEAGDPSVMAGGIIGVEGVIDGAAVQIASDQVILATGGMGGLWSHTTNPPGALGQGLALAAQAGAALIDLEFEQFHPTAIDIGADPMPLASEAIRGEGAVLIDDRGMPVMNDHPQGDLAPRDVVARGVWRRINEGRRVYLDARQALGSRFADRFPTVDAMCKSHGIDPATMPIPIRPAAHYHMGGIQVDEHGRSTVPGLWACGEAAATGLHGANRLASNSLLEAVVTGIAVASELRPAKSGVCLPVPRRVQALDAGLFHQLRRIMGRYLGVSRDRTGISTALGQLLALAEQDGTGVAGIAAMVAGAALRREESRGSHFRSDFPARLAPQRTPITFEETVALGRASAGTFPLAVGA